MENVQILIKIPPVNSEVLVLFKKILKALIING
jgi:hypothetical protein